MSHIFTQNCSDKGVLNFHLISTVIKLVKVLPNTTVPNLMQSEWKSDRSELERSDAALACYAKLHKSVSSIV